MRITIPLVALVAIFVGPSAFAQSPSQDNAGQIPNNSGAGVPGLPGNKSGPAHRPDGMTQDAHTPGTSPDQSNVPGLPGTKLGPTVQPVRAQKTRMADGRWRMAGFMGVSWRSLPY